MRITTRTIIAILHFTLVIQQMVAQNTEQIIAGTKHTIHSDILSEDREYWISLPESYYSEGSDYKRYPMLIVLDGNAFFDPISGMVSYMSSRSRRIPEMIVVAIQNVDRRRDFTPDKIVTVRENNSGGGEKFLSFLEEELIPKLDKDYRTQPYRILFGHSLGGLLATHTYMKESTKFNAFLAIDPSFGTWDAETMDKKLEAVTNDSFKRYIYLATANWDKRNIRNRDRHVRFYESMNSKSPGSFPAKMEYFENETHSSVPPIAFYQGISHIFQGYGIAARDIENKEQLIQHFQSISNRLSWNFPPPEALVNQLGYSMLQSKNENGKELALEYFRMNTANYLESFNAFDSLGEAYESIGDSKKAIENYKKSLELNPANEHAETRIEMLKMGK